MDNIDTCIKCGNLFKGHGGSICFKCKREEDQLVLEIRNLIRRKPDASADMICDEVNISVDLLSRLIDEGRIVMKQAESPLSCHICNQKISRGRICSSCAGDLSDGFETTEVPKSKKQQVTTRYFNKKR